jgi:glycosyltransferase involved in cell wall biosynthesis
VSSHHGGVSVVICAYTLDRWDDLCRAVESVGKQTLPASQLIVVVDHAPELLERARERFATALVLDSLGPPGVSVARNCGVAAADAEIVAFLDDDAAAEPDWLERLLAAYTDEHVTGVGGLIEPRWDEGRPKWFPREFDWVVGCSFEGMPTRTAPVRNLVGANMSVRRGPLLEAGDFRADIGRLRRIPVGCEETEICIRIGRLHPDGVFLHEPSARVQHRVRAARGRWDYFISRCYGEGLSKARVARFVGSKSALSTERSYTLKTLPRGVTRELWSTLRGRDRWGAARAGAIVAGLAATAAGYAVGAAKGLLPARSQGRTAPETATAPLSSRSRVLVVTPRYLPEMGGVENHVRQVTRRLGDETDITLLTTDVTGELSREETIDGVRVIRVRAWPRNADYRFAPGVYRTILRGDWDLVHVQSYHTAVAPLAMLAAKRAGIPYVVTFHGGGHSSRLRTFLRQPQWSVLRPLLAGAEKLIAVAEFEAAFFSRRLRIPPERFAVIPNGSDLPTLPDGEGAAPPDRPVIASVGRLERYKGHHRVIAAMPYVLAERPGAELHVIGSGPFEQQLVRLASRLGISDRVVVRSIPPADRLAMTRALAGLSLFVLMSEFETHPLAVLEAVALGRPALVADTSGLRELAEHGLAHAIPVDSGARDLASAIIAEIDHPHPVPHVVLPTWDVCAARVAAVYREVLTSQVEACA